MANIDGPCNLKCPLKSFNFCVYSFLPQCFIALAMIGIGDIGGLVDFFSFTAWLFYGTAAASLLVMRYTKRDVKRIIKVDYFLFHF